MTDNDVQALKEFRAELESSDVDAARARVRHKIARAVDTPAPRHRWIPVAATAGAAAAILIGTVVVLQPGGSGRPGPTGIQAGDKPTAAASTPGALPNVAAVTLPRAEPGPLTAEGLTVGPNQLLYVRSRTTGYQHEQWAEPDGMIVVAIQRMDYGQVSLAADEASMQQEAANQRARFAAEGPSIALPTRQYLAGLTTDPVALRKKLKSGLGSLRDDMVIKDATDWLYRVDPILTPRIRMAVVQALDTLPGVRVDHSARTFGGRSVYVVEQKDSRGTDGLIVDTATGRFVGSYAAGPGYDAWATATRWEFAVVNR